MRCLNSLQLGTYGGTVHEMRTLTSRTGTSITDMLLGIFDELAIILFLL